MTNRRQRRTRAWLLRRLGLLLAGLALGLGLAELGARLARPPGNADLLFDSPNATPDGLYMAHERLLRLPVPNFQGRINCLGFSAPLRINSLGLRGDEVPAPSANKKRWLTLGDSFVIALQVREEDTFQARLQRDTGQLFFNGGVDTYSTWQATGRYRLLSPKLKPDGVILVLFLGNDFVDNVEFKVRKIGLLPVFRGDKPGGRASRTGDLLPAQDVSFFTRWLMAHSFLYGRTRVWYRLQSLRDGTHHSLPRWRTELALFTTDGEKLLNTLIPATEKAILELRDAARQRGDKLLVALAPPAFQVDEHRAGPTLEMVGIDPATRDLDAPLRALEGALKDLSVQTCDLTPPLREATRKGAPTFYMYDGHWTPRGHQVVARTIASCLKKRGW